MCVMVSKALLGMEDVLRAQNTIDVIMGCCSDDTDPSLPCADEWRNVLKNKERSWFFG